MFERGAVRCCVDSAGKSRGYHEAFLAKFGRDLAGEFLAHRRAVPRADNRHDRNAGKIEPAFDIEERRRRIDPCNRRRITLFADGNERCADPLGRFELGLRLGFAIEADVRSPAPP
jgi:hypothetical protein